MPKAIKTRAPLMPVEDALAAILGAATPITEIETVPLLKALGRVLAADQSSAVDVPPCDNSAMDGYAIRYSDLAAGAALAVSQRIPAGTMGESLAAGTAARIFTGAAIPDNADTVVMQEDTESAGEGSGEGITVTAEIKVGQHIRPKGQDIRYGSVVIAKGKRLQPQDIGLLASIGATEVDVFRPLKVAVLSTGDELVEPGTPLAEGQIYNSNRYTLSALLTAMGYEVMDGGIVADDFDITCQQLQTLAERADIIISSGGVSVGEEDHVKAAVESLGELGLWKLNIKPGKPLAFGSVSGTPFFGLPGNPSSVFVTFSLLARPYLLRYQGQAEVAPIITKAEAGFDWQRAGTRQEYLRAKVQGGKVELYPNQSSGVLASASWANALVVLPPNTKVATGDQVQVILLTELSG
ncbi:gephyrin-like molybdotransferase Glp [Oceanicoccus sagamiensis]|uniref:Molybdopterin molybdenumtransferase n=1 Tax=Oceanicoccus sagamiensis TaxID=716816 RepID=A0A1X9NHW3_9GAMM|nr:gephyrin-like molybdotransferase Glp [Oceanicoccus sagamiensis]ARN74497.1 molybdopterin molybdenumtransferase MoeA [Oceanicoccus sagamiensis]